MGNFGIIQTQGRAAMTTLSLFHRLFARSITRDRMRRSFRPLLDPTDDRMLDDIGLTRAEIETMVLGLDRSRPQALVITFPSGRALSARLRA
ncbi:DUF1127 domain-containing protein [Tabrizicola sp.]|uniref:DUF1127 domain-containing protein n=1 Tax=Tabrizicola sp. TaxID=2005166 RepID=UPI00286B61DA|nr:DUF1127 domain-containing protein [Tabrizicola sp.]